MGDLTARATPVAMDPAQRRLWARILAYEFDDGLTPLSFLQRLSRENGWTTAFAERAIEEYRRFIFLAVTAGHPVTPSDQVDQVWHLHLTYTEAYWSRLCQETLDTPIHHGPTRGGPSEARKFRRWYSRTLARYLQVFGETPPSDVWPAPDVRFGVDLHFRRVNTARHWIVPKPSSSRLTARGFAVAASAMVVVGLWKVGHTGLPSVRSWLDLFTPSSLAVVGAGIVLVLAFVSAIRQRRCERCGRWAFRPNGFTDDVGRHAREEWECERCGHRAWKQVTSGGGCGCGDGGGCSCSGCS